MTTLDRCLRVALLLALFSLIPVGAASADLNNRLDRAQSKLDQTKTKAGILTTTVEHNAARVDGLRGQLATLRNRQAIVRDELRSKEIALKRAHSHLVTIRDRLKRSIKVLSRRLVDIYRSDDPDAVTVLLNSDGFDDLVTRYRYLQEIQTSDRSVAVRVRGLRDAAAKNVARARTARQGVAAREAELTRTASEVEGRQTALTSALTRQREDLAATRSRKDELSDHVSNLQSDIEKQLRAAAAVDSTAAPSVIAAGPPSDPSASGLIWPVEGVLTSPFGPRWGSIHPGIDIGAPTGTPIRAAKSGVVVNAASNGGYGNFTCINHGGGLSTCYAHQSAFATAAGAQVKQGDVIGYVGSTGFSTGPHLHFEVRIDGQAVDPLGYL